MAIVPPNLRLSKYWTKSDDICIFHKRSIGILSLHQNDVIREFCRIFWIKNPGILPGIKFEQDQANIMPNYTLHEIVLVLPYKERAMLFVTALVPGLFFGGKPDETCCHPVVASKWLKTRVSQFALQDENTTT